MIIVFNSSGPGGIWGGLALFLLTAFLSGELPLLTLDLLTSSFLPLLLVIGVAAWLFSRAGGQRPQQQQQHNHQQHQQHHQQPPFHPFNGPFHGFPSPPWFGTSPSWFPFSGGPFPPFQHLFQQQWPGFPNRFGSWYQSPNMGRGRAAAQAGGAQQGRQQQQQQQNRRRYTVEEVATALHKLPVETFSGVQQGTETSTDHVSCSICCDDYCEGDAMRVLPCGHQYHIECVDRWFLSCTDYTRAPACPLCNKPLIT